MKNRQKTVFVAAGIFLSVILVVVFTYVQAFSASTAKAKANPWPEVPPKVQNMSKALNEQKTALHNIAENGHFVPDYFLNYDILYFKNLDNGRYEIEIQGVADFTTMVSHEELYSFKIDAALLKSKEGKIDINNITKDAFAGLLEKTENLPENLNAYSIVYYKDLGEGDYEFGIETNGIKYYFLLENHSRFTPQGNWSVLGWSEGSLPEDWNDVLAIQKYNSKDHITLDEKEYEKFFADYTDRIYKLIAEHSKLLYDMGKYHEKTFGSKHYNLVAAKAELLYNESDKVMKVEVPKKYRASHSMLVQAMYRVSRITAAYVKGCEGYKDEVEYNNSVYEPSAGAGLNLINKAYACFEAEKRSEAFNERKYNEIELKTKWALSNLIDKYYDKHFNATRFLTYWGTVRVNNTQYEAYVDENYRTYERSFRFTFEKDKKGNWIIVSRAEM